MKNEQNIAVRIYGNICVKMPLRTWLGVKYFAHDKNGDLYGYDKKPLRKMKHWDVASQSDKSVFIARLGTFARDWTVSFRSVEQILKSPANAELAAWEKENNIAHPVPEETLEVLLDILMEAPNQAAEPTAGEDTAPVEDDSICLQLPDGQTISMTWVAWLRAEYITVNRANVVEGWEGLPLFEHVGGNWVGETSRTAHEFFITQLPKYKQPTRWHAWELLKLEGNRALAEMEEAFEQQTGIKIHSIWQSDIEKAMDWYTQYRANFGKTDALNQAAEPTACEDTAPDKDTARSADPVNHPEHYRSNGIERIDAIRAVLTPEQFEGYCRGNAMKYLWRAGKKVKPGQTVEEAREEDLAKARWYLDTVIKQRETNRELARLADWAVAAMKEILAKARKDGADHD
jgi:hypothetical protein